MAKFMIKGEITLFDVESGVVKGNERGLKEISNNIVTEAKLASPSNTGRLRNSIHYKLAGGGTFRFNDGGGEKAKKNEKIPATPQIGESFVGTNVHYAIYQEFGTKYVPPHPFMRPAVRVTRGDNVAAVIKWQKEEVKKASNVIKRIKKFEGRG